MKRKRHPGEFKKNSVQKVLKMKTKKQPIINF